MLHAHCSVEQHSQRSLVNQRVWPVLMWCVLVSPVLHSWFVQLCYVALAPVVCFPTRWHYFRSTNYQGFLSLHTVMTVDVITTWMQCLCPTVMSHLEQAACYCFVNSGLGDTTFRVGLVDLCTSQGLLHQSILHIQKNPQKTSMQQRYLTNHGSRWGVTDESDVSFTNNRSAKNSILVKSLK